MTGKIAARVAVSFAILAAFFASSFTANAQPSTVRVMDMYCAGCHNGSMRSPSGALLDQFDATRIAENPEVWARAYRQLQAGTMPPVGAPRPDRGTYDAVLASIEPALGEDAKTTRAT